MKINEVLAEGFWAGVGQAVGIDPNQNPFTTAVKGQRSQDYTFDFNGKKYKRAGNMWQVQNPTTGKFFPAPKDMQDQLNAAAGDEVKQRPGKIQPIAPINTSTNTNTNTNTIKPIPKSGAPTDAEYAKLQAKIDAASKAQGQ
jgi:hypothetical protein